MVNSFDQHETDTPPVGGPVVDGSCAHCQKPMLVRVGRGRKRRYHDEACRQAAYRKRHGAGTALRKRRQTGALFEERQKQAVSGDLRRAGLISDKPGARDDMPGDPLRAKPREEVTAAELQDEGDRYTGVQILQMNLDRDLQRHIRDTYRELPAPLTFVCRQNGCGGIVNVKHPESHKCETNIVTQPSIGEGAELTADVMRLSEILEEAAAIARKIGDAQPHDADVQAVVGRVLAPVIDLESRRTKAA